MSAALDMAAIRRRSRSLYELIEDARGVSGTAPDDGYATALIGWWRGLYDGTGQGDLDARLAKDGTTRAALLAAFHGAVPAGRPAAPWEAVLSEAARRARSSDLPTPSQRVAFGELLTPFVDHAARRIDAVLAETGSPGDLRRIAMPVFRAWLLGGLGRIASRSLLEAFNTFRGPEATVQASLLTAEDPGFPTDRRRAFGAAVLQSGYATLLEPYPVLGRLLGEATDNAVHAFAEFLRAYAQDRDLVADLAGTADGPIGIALGLSDPHNRGRSVIRMDFPGARTVYFKPRKLAIEAAFAACVDAMIARGFPFDNPVPTCLSRGTYGWARGIGQGPADRPATAADYFRNAGALLCLCDVFLLSDCHSENIVADGDRPWIVDAETLFHFVPNYAPAGKTALDRMLAFSVLRTALLPNRDPFSDDGTHRDIAGLWGGPVDATYEARTWRNLANDAIVPARETRPFPPARNAPATGDAPAGAAQNVDALVDGYEAAHLFLQRHGRALLATDAFAALCGLESRFVLRGTALYESVCDISYDARFMRSGLERSIVFESLTPSYFASETAAESWEIVRVEHEALWRGDIPVFAARNDRPVLTCQPVPEDAAARRDRTAFAIVSERLRTLGPEDCAVQTRLIRRMLSPAAAGGGPSSQGGVVTGAVRWQALALDIADRVLSDAITCGADEIGWIGTAFDATNRSRSLRPIDRGLYDGTSGIGLFLAACLDAEMHPDLERRCRDALDRIVAGLDRVAARDGGAEPVGPDLASGRAGMAYAAAQIARATGAARARRVACRLSRGLAGDAFGLPVTDLLGGGAGALAALRAVDPEGSGAAGLARDIGVALGVAPGDAAECGFAHGQAGALAVLLEGQAVAPDPGAGPARHLRDAVRRALAELPEQDFTASRALSWCNGLPGLLIPLLRLARATPVPDGASGGARAFRAELDHALDALDRALPAARNLTACCGLWGAVDVLIEAALCLDEPRWLDAARRHAADRLVGASGGRTVLRHAGGLSPFCPGLLQGISGAGYVCLRLAEPARMASVLTVPPRLRVAA